MARLVRAPTAKADAREIWAYIAADDFTAADRLLDRFDRAIQKLSLHPLLPQAVLGREPLMLLAQISR